MLLEQYRDAARLGDRRRRRAGTGDATAISEVVAALPRAAGAQLRHQRAHGRGRSRQHRRSGGSRTATPSSSATSSTRPTPPAGRRWRRSSPTRPTSRRPTATSSCPSCGEASTATTWSCSCSRPGTTTSSPPSPATPTPRRPCARPRTSATGSPTSWPWAWTSARTATSPRCAAHIRELCAEGRGWASDDGYMVAVALFTRNPDVPGDRAGQLLRALQVG